MSRTTQLAAAEEIREAAEAEEPSQRPIGFDCSGHDPLATPDNAHLVCLLDVGFETELPLRRAIAVGEAQLDADTGVFLGWPLVEVARTERAQRWIGASFGPSFSKPGFSEGFYLHTVLPYKSHFKDPASEWATGITVDWPRRWRESRKTDPRPVVRALDRDQAFSDYYSQVARFVSIASTCF